MLGNPFNKHILKDQLKLPYEANKTNLTRKREVLTLENRKRIRRDCKIEKMKTKLKEMQTTINDNEKIDHLLNIADTISTKDMTKKKRPKTYSGIFNI